MSREAVLLLNHFLDSDLASLYAELVQACGVRRDVFLLSDRTQRSLPIVRLPRQRRELVFTQNDLRALGFPGKQNLHLTGAGARSLKLGNAELPVLLFAKAQTHYDYYWVIEYDVRFSGSWDDFFAACATSTADLLGTSISRFDDNPDWSHWPSMKVPAPDLPRSQWLRGFFPVYRLSTNAIACIKSGYEAGAQGHMESLVPTLVHQGGLLVEDIGGEGEFVPPGNESRFYTNNRISNDLSPGSFVYRPVMLRTGARSNTLWHPVKPPKPKWKTVAERIWGRGFMWLEEKLGIERSGQA